MRDPIDQLSNFDAGADVNPLPPSEIRRRGDRLRRRNHLLAAAGAAVVVALIVVPLAVLGGQRAADGPDPAPPSDGLSEANLMTDAETEFHGDSAGFDWVPRDTVEGDGQAAFSPCAREGLAGLGAGTVIRRDFDFTDGETVEDTNTLVQVAGEFPDEATAAQASETIAGWLQDCSPRGAEEYGAGDPLPVEIGVEGEAQLIPSSYWPVPEEIDPRGDENWLVETGLVLSGNRVTVITQTIHGQDYNWPQGGTPMERMLPPAADRLVKGGTAQDEEPPAAVTRIPDSFPLTSGMPDGTEEGEQFFAPGRDLEPMSETGAELHACGESPAAGDPTDRLTVRITGPANGQARELQLFADDAAAAAYVDTLRAHYEACPEDDQDGGPPFVSTTVRDGAIGEESVDIRRSFDDAGESAITVVRVGNAVTVENISDEGNDVDSLATMARENLADVVAAMHDLVDGEAAGGGGGSTGPSGGPGPSNLGGDIPDAFPLAAGWPDTSDADTRLRSPNRALPSLEWTACDTTLEEGRFADRLVAGWKAPEDVRARQLTTYETANDAVAAVAELVDLYRSCPVGDEGEDRMTPHHEVVPADLGGEAYVIYSWDTFDGEQTIFGETHLVVRWGRAVLVSDRGGHAGAPEGRRQEVLDGLRTEATDVIAAMCAFTEAGC